MPKYVLIGLIIVIGIFMIMNYWPKLQDSTKNKMKPAFVEVFDSSEENIGSILVGRTVYASLSGGVNTYFFNGVARMKSSNNHLEHFRSTEEGSQTIPFVIMVPLLVWSIVAMLTFTDAFRARAIVK